MSISSILETVKITSGSAKIAELKKANSPLFNSIFSDCYGPQTYGIIVNVDAIANDGDSGILTIDADYEVFHSMLESLASRKVTGMDARILAAKTIHQFVEFDKKWLAAILNRDLGIGVSYATYLKEIAKTGEKPYEVTLAFNLDKVKNVNVLDGTYYASRKCDGCRCTAHIHKHEGETTVKYISRQGKEFTTLSNLTPGVVNLVKYLPNGDYVADGEICKVDENGNEDFQAVMKEIRKKDHTIEDPCYQLFDFVSLDIFEGRAKSGDFAARFNLMQKMFEGNTYPTVRLLKQELIQSQADFDRWSKYVEDGNWEGFMLRKNVPFETGRTKNLLKVKKFEDGEYVVEGVIIGKMTTAEAGRGNVEYEGVTALEITHKGNKVKVGSGLTKDQRVAWMENPNLIVGKTITVKYFERTTNEKGEESLRFPTLKHVFENGRDV